MHSAVTQHVKLLLMLWHKPNNLVDCIFPKVKRESLCFHKKVVINAD